jgi:hypothetical protein
VAFDAFILQHAMKPKAVQTRLLNDNDRKVATRPSAKRFSSPATSPLRTECFDIFSSPPGHSDVISQLEPQFQ